MYLTQKKSILFNPIFNAIAGVLMKKNISGKNKQTHTELANHKKFCQEAKKITYLQKDFKKKKLNTLTS